MKILIIILLISVLLFGCTESGGYSDTKEIVGGIQGGNSQGATQKNDPKGINKGNKSNQAPSAPQQNSQTKRSQQEDKYWLISIDETIEATLLNSGELPCKNTMKFVASCTAPTPYDGQFSGYMDISSHTDLKEAGNLGDDMVFLDMKSEHKSKKISFTLVPENIASLTRPTSLHPLIKDYSKASVTVPLIGDNFGNIFGMAKGYGFSNEQKLNISINCEITQLNDEVTIETDLFGAFKGEILEVSQSEAEAELAPLVKETEELPELEPLVPEGEELPELVPLVPQETQGIDLVPLVPQE